MSKATTVPLCLHSLQGEGILLVGDEFVPRTLRDKLTHPPIHPPLSFCTALMGTVAMFLELKSLQVLHFTTKGSDLGTQP